MRSPSPRGHDHRRVKVNIIEIRKPTCRPSSWPRALPTSSSVVVSSAAIAAAENTMREGALVKVRSGRLGGHDRRAESEEAGGVPLTSLDQDRLWLRHRPHHLRCTVADLDQPRSPRRPKEVIDATLPRNVKYRKHTPTANFDHIATRGTKVSFGDYGLQALEGGEITSRQIDQRV